jgi:hypothetical protein
MQHDQFARWHPFQRDQHRALFLAKGAQRLRQYPWRDRVIGRVQQLEQAGASALLAARISSP